MDENKIKIDAVPDVFYPMPIRQCNVCRKYEYEVDEPAFLVDEKFWLCDNCLSKLRKLLVDE